MDGLNELFEQILHSEQNFKAGITKIRELSFRIQQCQVELQQMKERGDTLQGELVVKNMRLTDMQVKCKLLCVHRDILQEQRDKLSESKRQLVEELSNEVEKLESQRQSFTDELSEFGRCFDLHGSGCKYRQEEARKQMSILQDELLLLETELTEMDSQKEEVFKLEQELADAEHKLRLESGKGEELKKTGIEQECKVKHLEEEKNVYIRKFSKDPEFIRLQRELEACKECPEELACQHFRTELEELQKRCYHKEMSQHLPLQRSTGSKSTSTPNENNTAFRRSGHYNPYTHQYVPARKLFQSVAPSRPGSLHTSSGVSGLKGKKSGETSVDDSGFQDDSLDCEGDSELNLVDEEWLMEDSDIDMELDERELVLLEDNLHKVFIDVDDLPVDGNSDCRSRREVKKSQVPSSIGSDSGSHRPAARNYDSTFSSVRSKPNGLSSAMADTTTAVGKRTLTGHTKSTVQGGISSSVGAFSHKTNSVELSTIAGQRAKPLNPVKTKKAKAVAIFNPMLVKLPSRREAGRGRGVSDKTVDSSRVTDSPEPDSHALRKRPGQSIFKAPGQQQQNSGLPKSAKKVRFHY